MAFQKRGTPQPATILDKCSGCKKLTSTDELKKGLCAQCTEKNKESKD